MLLTTFANPAKTDLIPASRVIKFVPEVEMNDDEFFDFCQQFETERIERNAEGEVIITPGGGFLTGVKNADIVAQLQRWAKIDERGIVSDSNGGYILPNGATRIPDAAWILKTRLETISLKQQEKFLPLCPDFVVELTSPSDSLKETQAKMIEYTENGVDLGWLIHRKTKQLFIYRPDAAVEVLESPETVSGESLLSGFELDLREIW